MFLSKEYSSAKPYLTEFKSPPCTTRPGCTCPHTAPQRRRHRAGLGCSHTQWLAPLRTPGFSMKFVSVSFFHEILTSYCASGKAPPAPRPRTSPLAPKYTPPARPDRTHLSPQSYKPEGNIVESRRFISKEREMMLTSCPGVQTSLATTWHSFDGTVLHSSTGTSVHSSTGTFLQTVLGLSSSTSVQVSSGTVSHFSTGTLLHTCSGTSAHCWRETSSHFSVGTVEQTFSGTLAHFCVGTFLQTSLNTSWQNQRVQTYDFGLEALMRYS